MSIILHFYPNGEFTQGYSSPPKARSQKTKKRSQKTISTQTWKERRDTYLQYKQDYADIWKDDTYWSVGSWFVSSHFGELQICELTQTSTTFKWHDRTGNAHITTIDCGLRAYAWEANWSPLGLSNARILEKAKPSRKKCLKMTNNMGRNVRNACYMLEHKYGKDSLSFLTLTIPNLSKSAIDNISRNWDTITNGFLKWLTRRIEAKGFDAEYVYVTEIQLKRLHDRGEYAPHLHIVFRGRKTKKAAWAISPKMARKAWIQQLRHYTTEAFTETAVENLQRIRKSASRYLSKYMSKGKNCLPSGDADSSPHPLHTHWGGMSRNLSRVIKKASLRISSSSHTWLDASCFLLRIDEMFAKGYISYWKRTYIQFGGDDGEGRHGIHVGVGKLARPLIEGGIIPCLKYLESLLLGQS